MKKYLKEAYSSSFKTKSIPSLDGIRAISILLVIFGHSAFMYSSYLLNLSQYLGKLQSIGVSIFFVLSGFLINGFLIKEKSQSDKIDYKLFYFKRFFRIFPPFYFYILVIVIFLNIYPILELEDFEILSALSYTWNYVYETQNWFLGHSWSLSVEEQFYLTWPFVIGLISLRNTSKFPLIIILLSPFIRIASYYLFPDWRSRLPIMFHSRADSLMFGCWLAYIYDSGAIIVWVQKIEKYKLHVLSFIFLFLASPYLKHLFQGKYTMTLGYTLEGIAIINLMAYILFIKKESKTYRLLNGKILRHIGILSYGLYLWQQLFLSHYLHWKFDSLRFLGMYLAVISIYILVEYPMSLWSKKLQKKYFSNIRPKLRDISQ